MGETLDLIPISDYKPANEITVVFNQHDTTHTLSEKANYARHLLLDRVLSTLEDGYVTITDLPILARTVDILAPSEDTESPESLLEKLEEKYLNE